MKEQCANVEKQRDERAKMRAAEIAAVSDAIKILNDDDALDVFKKALPSAALVQQPIRQTYDALLQLSRSGMRVAKLQPAKKHMVLLSVNQKTHEEPQMLLGAEGDGVGNHATGAEKL